MNISRAVRSCRLARRLSQQELAARAAISPSYLSLIESGKKEPSLPLLRDLAMGLSLPVDMLILTAVDFENIKRNVSEMSDLFSQMLTALVVGEAG